MVLVFSGYNLLLTNDITTCAILYFTATNGCICKLFYSYFIIRMSYD